MSRNAVATPREAAEAVEVLRHVFADALLAAYLHGSAVAGGLRPHSDVDVLAVVASPTTAAERRQLAADLLRISSRPGGGSGRPIELIVLWREDLRAGSYPRRAELTYGEWLRPGFEAGLVPEPRPDPELSVLLAQARQHAQPLTGPAASDLLPAIPEHEVRRSIGDALPALIDTLEGDERNVLLTLARMLRTLATGEIVPKDIAAAWAMPRLSPEAAELIGQARAAYLGLLKEDWRDRPRQVRAVVAELLGRVTAALGDGSRQRRRDRMP